MFPDPPTERHHPAEAARAAGPLAVFEVDGATRPVADDGHFGASGHGQFSPQIAQMDSQECFLWGGSTGNSLMTSPGSS